MNFSELLDDSVLDYLRWVGVLVSWTC